LPPSVPRWLLGRCIRGRRWRRLPRCEPVYRLPDSETQCHEADQANQGYLSSSQCSLTGRQCVIAQVTMRASIGTLQEHGQYETLIKPLAVVTANLGAIARRAVQRRRRWVSPAAAARLVFRRHSLRNVPYSAVAGQGYATESRISFVRPVVPSGSPYFR